MFDCWTSKVQNLIAMPVKENLHLMESCSHQPVRQSQALADGVFAMVASAEAGFSKSQSLVTQRR
jgi:hypothetical protein